METTKVEATVETMNANEAAVMEHNTCCLCGTDLKFQHKIDFESLKVVEDAHCPSCRIKLRTREHVLN